MVDKHYLTLLNYGGGIHMLMEPEIYSLYLHEEPFRHSYFAYLDEYEALTQKYMYLYAGLEETLKLGELDALIEMLKYQDEMEKFRAMHHFRQGVLLEKEALTPPKKKNILDFPRFH